MPSAVPIFASDVAFRMVDFARRNARARRRRARDRVPRRRRAGAARACAAARPARHADAQPAVRRAHRRARQGWRAAIRRAAQRRRPTTSSRAWPSHWKRAYTHPAGWTAWVLSPDMKLPTAMRLKESRRVPLWNGPIECRLFRFDLVAGSAAASTRAERDVGERWRAAPCRRAGCAGRARPRAKPAARAAADSAADKPPSGPLSICTACCGMGWSASGDASPAGLSSQRRSIRTFALREPCAQQLHRLDRTARACARICSHAATAIARQCSRRRCGALAGQAQHRTLGEQRLDRCRAELGRLLDQRVHALVGRHADRERDRQRELATGRIDAHRPGPARRCGRCSRRERSIRRRIAVEQHDRRTRLQAQHLHVARCARAAARSRRRCAIGHRRRSAAACRHDTATVAPRAHCFTRSSTWSGRRHDLFGVGIAQQLDLEPVVARRRPEPRLGRAIAQLDALGRRAAALRDDAEMAGALVGDRVVAHIERRCVEDHAKRAAHRFAGGGRQDREPGFRQALRINVIVCSSSR